MALTWSEKFDSLSVISVPGIVTEADWILEARDPSRVSLVDGGGVRLHTEPGDNHIAWSGDMERCDLYRCHRGTADPEVYRNGTSQWWAHELILPEDFQLPHGESTNVFDFHNTGDSLSASMAINFGNFNQPDWTWGNLQLQRVWGTNPMKPTILSHVLGNPKRNIPYRFLYQVRWSDKSDGYFRAWLNGELVVTDGGPTLFPGQGVYLKLACYRYPTNPNAACSVIHRSVRLGTSRNSVEN